MEQMGYFAGSEYEESDVNEYTARKSNQDKPINHQPTTQTSRAFAALPTVKNAQIKSKSKNLEVNIDRIWNTVAVVRENAESATNIKDDNVEKLSNNIISNQDVVKSKIVIKSDSSQISTNGVNKNLNVKCQLSKPSKCVAYSNSQTASVSEDSDSKTIIDAMEISNIGCINIEWTNLDDTLSKTLTEKHPESKDLEEVNNNEISMIVVSAGDSSDSNIFKETTEISNMGCVNIEWTQLEGDNQIANIVSSEKDKDSNSVKSLEETSQIPSIALENVEPTNLGAVNSQSKIVSNRNIDSNHLEKNTQTSPKIVVVPGIVKVIDLDCSQILNIVDTNSEDIITESTTNLDEIPITSGQDKKAELVNLKGSSTQVAILGCGDFELIDLEESNRTPTTITNEKAEFINFDDGILNSVTENLELKFLTENSQMPSPTDASEEKIICKNRQSKIMLVENSRMSAIVPETQEIENLKDYNSQVSTIVTKNQESKIILPEKGQVPTIVPETQKCMDLDTSNKQDYSKLSSIVCKSQESKICLLYTSPSPRDS